MFDILGMKGTEMTGPSIMKLSSFKRDYDGLYSQILCALYRLQPSLGLHTELPDAGS